MAKRAPVAPRKAAAPPPAEEEQEEQEQQEEQEEEQEQETQGSEDDQTEQETEPTVFSLIVDAAETVDKDAGTQSPKETGQKYMQRIVTAISKVADDIWEGLPEAATDWYNAGAKALKAGKKIELPEGYEEPEEVAEASPRASTRKAAPKKANGDGTRKERAPRARKEGYTMRDLRRAVVKDPKITVDELIKEAEAANATFSRSSVNLALQTTRTVIELAREENHWR